MITRLGGHRSRSGAVGLSRGFGWPEAIRASFVHASKRPRRRAACAGAATSWRRRGSLPGGGCRSRERNGFKVTTSRRGSLKYRGCRYCSKFEFDAAVLGTTDDSLRKQPDPFSGTEAPAPEFAQQRGRHVRSTAHPDRRGRLSPAGDLEDVLTKGGFQTDILSSAEEALTLFGAGAKPYKALVTDVNLKGRLSGWDIGRRIRERDSAFPVVYMTGAETDRWAAQGVPNSILLEKPVRAGTAFDRRLATPQCWWRADRLTWLRLSSPSISQSGKGPSRSEAHVTADRSLGNFFLGLFPSPRL
jgi:CheY-like chemotaxis protein